VRLVVGLKLRHDGDALETSAAVRGLGRPSLCMAAAVTTARETTMTWLPYSGPAKVVFTDTGALPAIDGQAVTTATFTAPGTYRLIGSAADRGRLSTKVSLNVTVTP
jgi:hypothetical protein